AAGDEQLAGGEEPEVAGAQEGSLAAPGDAGSEGLAALLGSSPVAEGDAAAADPDLADDATGRGRQRLGVDDRQPLAALSVAASHQLASVGLAGFERHDAVAGERAGGEREDPRRAAASGYQERRLRQPVAGL